MTKYDVNFTDRKYVPDRIKALINNKLSDKQFQYDYNKFLLDELYKNDEPSKEIIDAAYVQMFSCYDSFFNDKQKTAIVEMVQAAYQSINHKGRTSVLAGLTTINFFLHFIK